MELEKRSIYEKLNNKQCIEYFKKLNTVKNPELLVKSAEFSTQRRQEANALFEKSKHDSNVHKEIWLKYIFSIVNAPPDSEELALAYAGRSNLLLHMRMYKDCIKDVETALRITNSDCLKVRLFCYKAQCSAALRDTGIDSNALQKAKFWLKKIKEENKAKDALTNLIKKTTSIVDKGQRDIQEKFKMLKAHRTSSSVEIKHDRKYGRHLVATRDISPGEIVCVEKIYTGLSHFRTASCSHCLGVTWTLIPCDYCNWVLFCSKECKRRAWEKYHETECSVYPYIYDISKLFDEYTLAGLRLMLIALKECGSIEKIRKELISIDECTDERTKGMVDGKFCSNSFKSVYSLSSTCPVDITEVLGYESTVALYALAKYSKVFGENFTFTDGKDLRKNEDVIYIGGLILKFSSIFAANTQDFIELVTDVNMKDGIASCTRSRKSRGKYIAPITSLINHSCNPNVHSLNTNGGKVVYYCVQPIKKDSQIFHCYYQPFYSSVTKNERKRYLMENYSFKCSCEACENNWHMVPKHQLSKYICDMMEAKYKDDKIVGPILQHLMTYMVLIDELSNRDFPHRERVALIIGKDISTLMEHLSLPSLEIMTFINTLCLCFEKLYGAETLKPSDTCRKI